MTMTDSDQEHSVTDNSAELLFLPQIASWQIAQKPAVRHHIIAALPALQRGAVWKPQQVEALWDSVVRGFPIGAFMLTPFDKERGTQLAKHHQTGVGQPTHHLLDGQQRSTAVALGFLNPWTATESTKAVLWIDLDEPYEGSDLDFVFRVLTSSHPWGYKRSEPGSPITVGNIRDAMKAYRDATPEYESKCPTQFPLTHVWPWDAGVPIPLSLLVEEILSEEGTATTFTQRLLDRMRKLPFWGSEKLDWPQKQQKVEAMLNGKDAPLTERFQLLVEGLRRALAINGSYGVPVLMLPQMTRAEVVKDGQQDPIETLFIRVNQLGTRLEGEELIYSILKSNWPEAPDFIGKMQHKLAVPSRLLLFSARLILAEEQQKTERPPAVPSVGQFRRLIHGLDKTHLNFRKNLESFVRKDGVKVFDIARELLTKGDYALPAVLATDLAQKWPEAMFLLLCWIMRMRSEQLDPLQITSSERRQLLGFLTAMAWFAADREKSLAAVWKRLQTIAPKDLPKFFSRQSFIAMLRLDKQDDLQMLPLPPPSVLADVIKDCVTSRQGPGGGFKNRNPMHEFWDNWNRWESMSGRLTPALTKWYKENFHKMWVRPGNENEEALKPEVKYQEAWTQFINALWNKRSVLLYAQRDWLKTWFPHYDPSQPDQLEDMNRPWDYDHIHPQRYLKNEKGHRHHRIPNIIRDWHGSIGNFRAWPLEANRADSDTSPAIKLANKGEVEQRYGIKTSIKVRQASFVGVIDWNNWKKSVPKDDDFTPQYLANPKEYGECRRELIYAITTRFVALYSQWYESLKLGALMPSHVATKTEQ